MKRDQLIKFCTENSIDTNKVATSLKINADNINMTVRGIINLALASYSADYIEDVLRRDWIDQ